MATEKQRSTRTVAVIAAAVLVAAIAVNIQAPSVTQRMVLQRADTGAVIPCGGSASGIGDIIVTNFATAMKPGTFQFREGYGINGGNEAWYDNFYATFGATKPQLPVGVETMVSQVVQDVDNIGVTKTTFTFNSIGNTKLSCTINVSNIKAVSEGVTSQRPLVSGDLVDDVRIVAEEYATKKPVTCGDTTTDNLSRIRYTVQFFSDTGVWASVHTHVENPGKTGPDQNGDGLNNRWWERTQTQSRFVPANTWTTMIDVTTANESGINVIHGSEASQPDDRRIEEFCSFKV
jgi:hypothetical protein